VRAIQSQHAQGQASARNRGVGAVRGDIVAFLDDDDRYKPNHFEALVAGLRGSGAAIGYTRAEAVWRKSSTAGASISGAARVPWFRYARALLLVRNACP